MGSCLNFHFQHLPCPFFFQIRKRFGSCAIGLPFRNTSWHDSVAFPSCVPFFRPAILAAPVTQPCRSDGSRRCLPPNRLSPCWHLHMSAKNHPSPNEFSSRPRWLPSWSLHLPPSFFL